jgi:histone deacetylase HOS2
MASNIVQEWDQPRPYVPIDEMPSDQARKWAADNYGIERPKDYTVSFHFNPAVESFHFGKTHPMKPWRLTLTKQLVLSYGLQFAMDLYVPPPSTKEMIAIFHSDDYLDFLSK